MFVRMTYATYSLTAVMLAAAVQQASAQKIYWADNSKHNIQRANLDGSEPEVVIPIGFYKPEAMAVDESRGQLYWSEYWSDWIRRVDANGFGAETVVDPNGRGTNGLAVDGKAGKLYVAFDGAKGPGEIIRFNLDGSGREPLIYSILAAPTDIALHLEENKLYWIENESGSNGLVRRANGDGSGAETLLAIGISPCCLVLDDVGRNMYWIEISRGAVMRATMDGTNLEELVPWLAPQGLAIDKAERKLIWHKDDQMNRSDLDMKNTEPLFNITRNGAGALAFDQSTRTIYWFDYIQGRFLRADPEGLDINEVLLSGPNQPSSIEIDPLQRKIYFLSVGWSMIRSANLDGSRMRAIITQQNSEYATDLELTFGTQSLYWSSASPGGVTRNDLHSGQSLQSWDLRPYPPTGLTVDPHSELIYSVEPRGIRPGAMRTINRSTDEILVIDVGEREGLGVVALDAASNKLYWSDQASFYQHTLFRSNLDGSQIEWIHDERVDDLAIDLREEKLYWADCVGGSIRRSNLDGTHIETLYSDDEGCPYGIAVDTCPRSEHFGSSELLALLNCLTGPATPVVGDCICSDYSRNARVELLDFALLQRVIQE